MKKIKYQKCQKNNVLICLTVAHNITANSFIDATNLYNPLQTMTSILDNEYFITYSNYFKIEGKTFSFRKKVLFDITDIPKVIEIKDNNNCFGYWINRKWYSLSRLKDLVIIEEIKKDVSDLQWYQQIKLDYVF